MEQRAERVSIGLSHKRQNEVRGKKMEIVSTRKKNCSVMYKDM